MSARWDLVKRLLIPFLAPAVLALLRPTDLDRLPLSWGMLLVDLVGAGIVLLVAQHMLSARDRLTKILSIPLFFLGLFFCASELLADFTGMNWFTASWLTSTMAGGRIMVLSILAWLPARWMSLRGTCGSGISGTLLAWSLLLVSLTCLIIGHLCVDFLGVGVYLAVEQTRLGFAYGLPALRLVDGFLRTILALGYILTVPRILPKRDLMWALMAIVGVVMVLLPQAIDGETLLTLGVTRFLHWILGPWIGAPFVGRTILFASIVGLTLPQKTVHSDRPRHSEDAAPTEG